MSTWQDDEGYLTTADELITPITRDGTTYAIGDIVLWCPPAVRLFPRAEWLSRYRKVAT